MEADRAAVATPSQPAPASDAVASAAIRSAPQARAGLRARLTAGGTDGNELLTSATGGVLIALLAIIGLTIIQMRPLLSVHLVVGMLLIGPVALKLATTAHLPETTRSLRDDYGAAARLRGYAPGRSGRVLALVGALIAGVVVAILVIPQFGPWLSHPHGLHPH